MYYIFENRIRKAEGLSAEERAAAGVSYETADAAELSLLKQRAAAGDRKSRRALLERERVAEYLKERDAVVDDIIKELNRLGSDDLPPYLYMINGADNEYLRARLDELRRR